MKIFYTIADFDEHELHSEIFNSVEELSLHLIGVELTLNELKELAENEINGGEVYLLALLNNGYSCCEWASEEVYIIDENGIRMGL